MGNWCGKNKAVHPLKQERDELPKLNRMGNWCGKKKAVHPLKQERDELPKLNRMGNWCGKKKAVHPLKQERDELPRLNERSSNKNNLKVKVRLSKSQLNELMTKTDDSELGRLILQECFEGNLTARVVAAGNGDYDMKRSLSTIHE